MDKVVRDGILSKRNEYYWKQDRRFVLYQSGRVLYFEPKTNEMRGHLQLTARCHCERVSPKQFNLIVPGRTFNLYAAQEKALDGWLQDINAVLQLLN